MLQVTTSASPHTTKTGNLNTPTSSPAAANKTGGGGGGSSRSDRNTIGVGVGIGLPGTIGSIAGAYFAYLAVKRRRMAKNVEGDDGSGEVEMEARH